MRTINILSSIEGRKILHTIFRELQFEKQKNSIAILLIMWKICTHEINLNKYSNIKINVSHPLGFYKGTFLWLEEIVNRFYFSSFLSFVYFGAAFIILSIGIYRFTDYISINIVFSSIIFEVLMLILMFLVMLFSPKDDSYYSEDEKDDSSKELILEIGEIGRDLAAVVVVLEKLTVSFNNINNDQIELINKVTKIAENTTAAISPNPKMIEHLQVTNTNFEKFNNTLDALNKSLSEIKDEKLNSTIKFEIQKIIYDKLNK